MSEENQLHGVALSYDDMIPMPVITNNPSNNALVFNNPVQMTFGIASAEKRNLRIQFTSYC